MKYVCVCLCVCMCRSLFRKVYRLYYRLFFGRRRRRLIICSHNVWGILYITMFSSPSVSAPSFSHFIPCFARIPLLSPVRFGYGFYFTPGIIFRSILCHHIRSINLHLSRGILLTLHQDIFIRWCLFSATNVWHKSVLSVRDAHVYKTKRAFCPCHFMRSNRLVEKQGWR